MIQQNDRIETLIALGVVTARQIKVLRAALRQTEETLGELFPALKTSETINADAGSAERVVTREYSIKPGHLRDVRRILSDLPQSLIDEEYPMTLTPTLRAMVKNPNSAVGQRVHPHVIVETSTRVFFSEPLSCVIVTDGRDSEVIDLALIGADDHA